MALSIWTVRWQSCEHVILLTGTGRLFCHWVLPKLLGGIDHGLEPDRTEMVRDVPPHAIGVIIGISHSSQAANAWSGEGVGSAAQPDHPDNCYRARRVNLRLAALLRI